MGLVHKELLIFLCKSQAKITNQKTMPIEKTTPSPAILVSSASKKFSLIAATKAALHRIDPLAKVIAGDASASAPASYVADSFWVMPRTQDAMVKEILDGCLQRNIQVIFPTRDGELGFWSTHRQTFKQNGIQVVVSSEDAINRCIDKLAFAEYALVNAMPVIATSSNIDTLTANRFVVKERFGAGSRNIGINLDHEQAKKHAARLKNPIFQPFIEGIEFSVDAWLDKYHRVKGLILRQRNLVVNGESQITTTFTNVALEKIITETLEKLELCGPVVLQAILDKHQDIHIIECNARFGGASTAGIAAGIDSLYWSILEAKGHDVSDFPYSRLKGELRQIRIATDIYAYGSDF